MQSMSLNMTYMDQSCLYCCGATQCHHISGIFSRKMILLFTKQNNKWEIYHCLKYYVILLARWAKSPDFDKSVYFNTKNILIVVMINIQILTSRMAYFKHCIIIIIH